MKKSSNFKRDYIISAIVFVVCLVWLILGFSLLSPDASGAACFFSVTLPFLGVFGAVGNALYTLWKSYCAKKVEESQQSLGDKK